MEKGQRPTIVDVLMMKPDQIKVEEPIKLVPDNKKNKNVSLMHFFTGAVAGAASRSAT